MTWCSVISQSHIINGETMDEVFKEQCFVWERGASVGWTLASLSFKIFYMHRKLNKTPKETTFGDIHRMHLFIYKIATQITTQRTVKKMKENLQRNCKIVNERGTNRAFAGDYFSCHTSGTLVNIDSSETDYSAMSVLSIMKACVNPVQQCGSLMCC